VAHNTAASYVIRQHRTNSRLLSLQDVDAVPIASSQSHEVDDRITLERLQELIHLLKPPDRELMLLYLEGLDASAIGEIMGISPGNVRVQVHRIKAIIARRFHGRGKHE
jgi:RNA polymerase sigma-70 factor (ECF subfamily)